MLHHSDGSFLATYRPPELTFRVSGPQPASLRDVWTALQEKKVRLALRRGYRALREDVFTDDLQAALLAAIAFAEWANGVSDVARQVANASLSRLRGQWLAHRVLLSLHIAEKDFATAGRLLDGIHVADDPAPWDEPLPATERHLLRATCAWMTRDWDTTARQLEQAFPHGVSSMPTFVQEDWFRLAFYRERSDDAATAAALLVHGHGPERADVILQALVRQGWHSEALALYRDLFNQNPADEMLRRRMVGLCIREGLVDEARKLMDHGALRLAV